MDIHGFLRIGGSQWNIRAGFGMGESKAEAELPTFQLNKVIKKKSR